jgi:nicotinate-nucleotide pyrophosphorylase (carboxylating)
VATLTHAFVEKTKGTPAKIYDTRKTTPLFRDLDRYAVKTGGGVNHRTGLYDGVLIKDNHLKALATVSIKDVVARAKERVTKKIPVGIEVKNLEQLALALKTRADYVLIDNFKVEQVKDAVALRKQMGSRTPLEVSGGVNLLNVRRYAACGVERISVGALTHSVKAVDISLNLI